MILLLSISTHADIKVVGHRSTLLFAPENTLAAVTKAIELGVDIMEMDVRATRDGELVILHDQTVDRTTDGTGRIDQLTLKQVKALDAGIKFSLAATAANKSFHYAGERIPTLREMLRHMKGRALPDIDFKAGNLETLKNILIEEGFLEPGLTTFLGTAKEMQLVKSWNLWIRPTSALTLARTIKTYNPPIINVPEAQFSASYIQRIRDSGRLSLVNVILHRPFEVQRLKRVVEGRPDYIQTDRPDFLVPYLRSLRLHQ